MFRNIKLSVKLLCGFILVAVVLFIVGMLGYRSISKMSNTTTNIAEVAPLVDAAMEVKISVLSDMLLTMELLETDNKEELDELWEEHEKNSNDFDTYADAIIKGAETDEGIIYATKDEILKKIVIDADDFHNNEFQPGIKNVYVQKIAGFETVKLREDSMLEFEKFYDDIIGSLEKLETMIKTRISDKQKAGTDLVSILNVENTWADVSMEMKTTMGLSRIAMEEYLQSNDKDSLKEVVKEFNVTIEAFDLFIGALLNGASTKEGNIASVNDQEIKEIVKFLDKQHEKFQEKASQLIRFHDKNIEILLSQKLEDERVDTAGRKMMEMIGKIEEGAKAEIKLAIELSNGIASISKKQSVFGIVIGFILAVLLGILITRSITLPVNRITNDLNDSSEQTASAAGAVSSASQQLSQGATEQAASLEETSSSLDEMNSMTKQNADHANKANQLAQDARSGAEEGNNAMVLMQNAMQGINDSSDNIAKIIKTIEEIAFQTNLLALNAAVEAARAGEHGKGFAVVAEEVRNLAKRSADAAKDTAVLIEDNINKAKDGVGIANKAGDSLKGIMDNSKKVADIISEIAAASREQAEGIGQITNAVSQMDQVTQQNASASEECASSSEELSSQAEMLKGMVQELKVLVNGKSEVSESVVNYKRGDRQHSLKQFKPASKNKPTVNPDDVIPMEEDESGFEDF